MPGCMRYHNECCCVFDTNPYPFYSAPPRLLSGHSVNVLWKRQRMYDNSGPPFECKLRQVRLAFDCFTQRLCCLERK